MELKLGYKQTEVGVIPEEWEVKPLSREIERLEAGVSVNSVEEDLKSYSHGQSVLKTSSVTEGQFLPYESKKIAPRDLSRVRLSPKADSIIISRMNTPDLVGECGYVEEDYRHLFLPDRLWMTKQRNGSDTSIRWLSYLLSNKVQKARIRELATGTSGSMKNLAKGAFLELLIPFPPATEQRAIAGALSDVDALLGALDQLIAKKRDLKEATMQQLLTGQTRLPGFEDKASFRQTEVGLIPEDWDAARLGDKTVKVGSGITPTGGAQVYKQQGRPFLRSQNVGWGNLLLDDVVFIDDETHAIFQDTEIEAKDVFLNITGASIGRSAVADARVQCGNVNQHVCIIRTNQAELLPQYLNYFLLSTAGQRQIDSFQAGGNRQGLNFGQVRSFRLPLPPPSEQTAIAEVLSDMDAELAALEQRRDKTRALKQGMMQELLTGKTRLV